MSKKSKTIIVVFTLMILFYLFSIPSFASIYTNANSAVSVQFTVPDGWEHQDLRADSDILKTSYTYSGDTGEFISFGYCDLASVVSMIQGKGAPDQYINSKAYFAAVTGVNADAIEIVNYQGIDYYKLVTDEVSGQPGICTAPGQSDTCTTTKLFCVINTTMFTFQYGSSKGDFSHFPDFEVILNNVLYTIPADSNNLEIYKLHHKEKSKDPSPFSFLSIMLYSLPIFIYGYSKRKVNGLR